jgi:threonine/homoserine/homoserine lactone efflux protein
MTTDLLLTAFVAAMAYVLIPGPATLAVLHLSATRGRRASLKFLTAHLVGDLLWSVLALLAIVGVTRLGPDLFGLLGIACGCYLIWLGAKALFANAETRVPMVVDPVRTGLIFGMTNPKAYPFALAMFTVVLGHRGGELAMLDLPLLFAAILFGFIVADLLVVAWTGLGVVSTVFHRLRARSAP